jgi:hypothetical protein
MLELGKQLRRLQRRESTTANQNKTTVREERRQKIKIGVLKVIGHCGGDESDDDVNCCDIGR